MNQNILSILLIEHWNKGYKAYQKNRTQDPVLGLHRVLGPEVPRILGGPGPYGDPGP